MDVDSPLVTNMLVLLEQQEEPIVDTENYYGHEVSCGVNYYIFVHDREHHSIKPP